MEFDDIVWLAQMGMLRLEGDDLIVVRLHNAISDQSKHEIMKMLRERFPEQKFVVLNDGGQEIALIRINGETE